MTYVAIADKLKTILTGITAIKKLYDYEAKELGGFPAATITSQGHRDSFRDQVGNRREFNFAIYLYYRTEDAATGESVMREIVDAVMAAIEADTTLSGSCDWARPSEATWGYTEREVPVRYAKIMITAVKRVAVR